jgi:DtxR family transcriptional regulator, Mn-dependent transcriptional regulator
MESPPKEVISRDAEELLEHLYVRQVEEAPAEGAAPAESPPAEALREVTCALLVERRGDGYALTDAGLAAARSVVRRHRLAECLLHDVLGVSDEQAMDADACEFEHVIRPGLEEKICLLLGHPRECPHGKPIPPGDCCRRAGGEAFPDVGPLSEGKVGGEGVVVYLRTRDRRDVQKLMALGILPGVPIRLIRRFPSYVFQIGFSQFTVDRELAEKIHVRWAKPA